MKTAFYFILKALFALEIITFLLQRFGYLEKWLDKKISVNSKVYDVTDWITDYQNIHIVQYLYKLRQNEIWSVNRVYELFFLKNHTQNMVEKLVSDHSIKNNLECISESTVWNVCHVRVLELIHTL